MVHHAGNAVRHHSKVFAAGQHTGGTQQLGELVLGVATPELVVAVVEEVVVQRAETFLLPLREACRCRSDQRLVHSGMAGIRMEEAVERQPHILNLTERIGQGGVEVTHHTALELDRDLPYAEEAEDMVDAERVEILTHLAQAGFPPGIVVLCHLFPVVGREAPVLTVGREVIRGSSGG